MSGRPVRPTVSHAVAGATGWIEASEAMSNVRLWEPGRNQPFALAGRRVDPAAHVIVSANSTVEGEPRVMARLIAVRN